jgi:hypothetical protein
MKMSNDTYCIEFRKNERIVKRYYRDSTGWLKISSRGRTFRMTAEQILNHLLPALSFGDRLELNVVVDHYDGPYWQTLED